MSNCDTPGLFLSHIKLKEDNYEQWTKLILIGMREKRKDCFINDTMKRLLRDSPKLAD